MQNIVKKYLRNLLSIVLRIEWFHITSDIKLSAICTKNL